MKNLFKSMLLVAVAAMGLTACSNNEVDDVVAPGKLTKKITVVGDITRTEFNDDLTKLVWSEGDTFGAFTNAEDVNLLSSAYTADATGFGLEVNADATTVYAYYPYDDYNNSKTASTASVTVERTQTQSVSGKLDKNMLPMVASGEIGNDNEVSLSFRPVACVLALNIYGGTSSTEQVTSVKISSTTKISGYYAMDLTNPEAEYAGYNTDATVALAEEARFVPNGTKPADATQFANRVFLVVAKAEYPAGTMFEVKTTESTYTFTSTGVIDCTDTYRTMNLNLAKAEAPKSGTVTIDFSTTDQRISQTTEKQVWANEDVIFTNEKGSSTSNIIDSSKPVRLYKNSTVIIEAPGNITEIVFTCNTTAYATSLNTSIGADNGDVSVNSKVVTVVPAVESTTYTVILSDGQVRLDSVDVSFGAPDTREAQTLTFAETEYTVTLGETFVAPTVEGAQTTVTYTSSNEEVAKVNATTGVVEILATGTTTITATATENEIYKEGEASYKLIVKAASLAGTGDGTKESPYDVTRAYAVIDEANGEVIEGVHVKGIVTTDKISFNSSYNSLTYYISVDGTTTNQLQAYSGKNLENENFYSVADLHAGDEVVVYGNLKKYNQTYEFDYNNYLVSLNCGHTNLEQEVVFTAQPESVYVGKTVTVAATAKTTVTYSSSNDAIATIDAETGAVKGVAEGEVTITATAAKEGAYKAASASYTLTVKPEQSGTLTPVTEEISFANTDQRASLDNNAQVWKNGNITFTNNKASSSTNVANYSNPVRLYQGSSVTITAAGNAITEVVIESDGTTKYKTALENSLNDANLTYTNSGNTYTVTVDSVTEVTFSMTAQARLKKLSVTYLN